MKSKRYWELAKELGMSTKQLLELAKQNGLNIKNPLCALESGHEEAIRQWAKTTTTLSLGETPDAGNENRAAPVEQFKAPEAVTQDSALPAQGEPLKLAIAAGKQASDHLPAASKEKIALPTPKSDLPTVPASSAAAMVENVVVPQEPAVAQEVIVATAVIGTEKGPISQEKSQTSPGVTVVNPAVAVAETGRQPLANIAPIQENHIEKTIEKSTLGSEPVGQQPVVSPNKQLTIETAAGRNKGIAEKERSRPLTQPSSSHNIQGPTQERRDFPQAKYQDQLKRQDQVKRPEQPKSQDQARRQEQTRPQDQARRQEQTRPQVQAKRPEQVRSQDQAKRPEQARPQDQAKRPEQPRPQDQVKRPEQPKRQEQSKHYHHHVHTPPHGHHKPFGSKEHTQSTVAAKESSSATLSSHGREADRSLIKLPPKESRKIEVIVPISVKDFSHLIGVRAPAIMQKLLESSKTKITLNESLDETMVEWLGLEFGKELHIKKDESVEEAILKDLQKKDAATDLIARAPVVTFMGHVDHGKTSLLDAIRKTNTVSQEAGGITQHIGAYSVVKDNRSIVFLDTPGHEAFSSMRARGAQVTDIVVLVVAADDGVMPQTVEAINHAKAANVPIVVALNKIDKPTAKPEQVMQQLAKYGLISEKWQGDTGMLEVSALTGKGITELLEYLILMAEMLELQYNPKRKAMGVVMESKMVEGRGIVATLVIRNGTLHKGDNILCGTTYGRVKDIVDHAGRNLQDADPSIAVEISGISELPDSGDKFYVLESASMARSIAEDRKKKAREKQLAKGVRKLTIEDLMKQVQKGEVPELKVVLKTDVHGSLEAISKKLETLATNDVKIKLLHAAVGGINERDVQLCDASQAIILGFNVTANKMARDIAEEKNVQIRYYNIIYNLLDDAKKIMQGLLSPEIKEEISGHAMVRQVFHISKVGNIAGCYVTDGIIERNSHIRVSRDGVVINKEKPMSISSLKHLKEDVNKVSKGFECGIRLDGFDDIKEGDEMEAFKRVSVPARS